MGRYEEALTIHEECRVIREATLGKSHPDYATTLGNIGGVYYLMGRYEEALTIYEECRVIKEATLGKSHPNYVETCIIIERLKHNLKKPTS